MGDGSYFDGAPQQGGFGRNTDGSMTDSFSGAVEKSLGNIPVYKQILAATDFTEKTVPLIGELFNGEADFDDLFNILDSTLTMAVNAMEGVEAMMAVDDWMLGDPSGAIATLLGTMVSMQLTFLLEYLQPVQDLFGMITGNPGRIRTSKAMWEALAMGLSPIGAELAAQSDRLGDAWQDDGSDAARLRLVEGNDVIQVAAALAEGVAGALEFCAVVFDKVQGFIINRISDIAGALVEYLPKIPKGPVGWAEIALDFIPMITRIQLELIQIGLHIARALGTLCGLMQGAEAAAEKMLPYIDRMGGEPT